VRDIERKRVASAGLLEPWGAPRDLDAVPHRAELPDPRHVGVRNNRERKLRGRGLRAADSREL
jgi:hypothetical protein